MLLAALACAVAAGWLASFDEPKRLIGVTVGVVAVPTLIVLTIWRFDLVVISLVITRVALDALKTGGAIGASLDPSVLVGAAFIAAAGSRLLIVPRRVPASPFTRGLYCLAAAAFVSAALSEHRQEAFIAASKVLSGTLMFAVLEQMLHERPELAKRIVLSALAAAVVPVVVALQQLATGTGNVNTVGFLRVYGTAVTPTSLATFLLPILAVLIAAITHRQSGRLLRRRAALLALAPLAVLYFTYTRSAWIALAIGTLYIVWWQRRSWTVPVLVALALTVILIPGIADRFSDIENARPVTATASANSLDWRFGYWKRTIDRVGDNWVTGIGLDTTQIDDPSHLAPHNIAVQLYVETGLLGCAAGLAALFGFAITLRRRRALATTHDTQILAVATGAVGIMVLAQGMAANVLTQTIVYWYGAAALAWGLFSVSETAAASSEDQSVRLPWTTCDPPRGAA